MRNSVNGSYEIYPFQDEYIRIQEGVITRYKADTKQFFCIV